MPFVLKSTVLLSSANRTASIRIEKRGTRSERAMRTSITPVQPKSGAFKRRKSHSTESSLRLPVKHDKSAGINTPTGEVNECTRWATVYTRPCPVARFLAERKAMNQSSHACRVYSANSSARAVVSEKMRVSRRLVFHPVGVWPRPSRGANRVWVIGIHLRRRFRYLKLWAPVGRSVYTLSPKGARLGR